MGSDVLATYIHLPSSLALTGTNSINTKGQSDDDVSHMTHTSTRCEENVVQVKVVNQGTLKG